MPRVKVTFACPVCEQNATATVDQANDWQCPACDHRLHLNAAEPTLPTCVLCGNHELYKKKDFPHTLGMGILLTAVVLSTITYYWYEPWLTWAFLIGSALIDVALYRMVGDVLVCYRCDTEYRGFKATDAHEPFEITIGERYRQEKMRLERTKGKTPSS